MRILCTWLTWIVCGAMACGVASARDLSGQERAVAAGSGLVGSAAPRITLKTIDGQVIDLGELYGRKAVYLKFWATWCTPCREQMPHFQRTYETAGSDLAVIAVNTGFNDSVEEVMKYRQRLHITMPIVMDDGRLAAAFNLRVTPQHIVIGRDGRIRYVGHLADAQLADALTAARTMPGGRRPGASAVAGTTALSAALRVGDRLPAPMIRRLGVSGQPTALLFLSPWCESYLATTRPEVSANCRAAREQVATLARDAHIHWLGIASGLWATPDDLRDYQAKYDVTIPLTLDESGGLFRGFAVTVTPTILLVSADGIVTRRIDAGQLGELDQAIAAL